MYSYKLHMALQNYDEATKVAVKLAKQEQDLGRETIFVVFDIITGNYKMAHNILFETSKELNTHHFKISSELKRNLMLLHSYVIAKVFYFNYQGVRLTVIDSHWSNLRTINLVQEC